MKFHGPHRLVPATRCRPGYSGWGCDGDGHSPSALGPWPRSGPISRVVCARLNPVIFPMEQRNDCGRCTFQATVNRMTAPSLDNASDYVSRAQRGLAKPQKLPARRLVQGHDSSDIAGDNHRPGGRFHCQSEHTRALEISSSAPHTRAVARPPKFGGGHRRVQDGDLGLAQFRHTWTEPSDPCQSTHHRLVQSAHGPIVDVFHTDRPPQLMRFRKPSSSSAVQALSCSTAVHGTRAIWTCSHVLRRCPVQMN